MAKLILRIIFSIALAWIISIFFFKGVHLFKTSLLAAILFGLAYTFEYTKKRDREKGD